MRVRALSRSLKVPPERIFRRKARSDAEPPPAFGRAENAETSEACKEEARSNRVDNWDVEWETAGPAVAGRVGRISNQLGVTGTTILALEDEAAGLLVAWCAI